MNVDNAAVQLAEPGTFRLSFNLRGQPTSGRSLAEIGATDDGLQMLANVLNWGRLDQVQSGARKFIQAYLALPAVRARGREIRKSRYRRAVRKRAGGATNADRERFEQWGQ